MSQQQLNWPRILLMGMGILIAIGGSWVAQAAAVARVEEKVRALDRIHVYERENIREDLARIEKKVDRILEKLDERKIASGELRVD